MSKAKQKPIKTTQAKTAEKPTPDLPESYNPGHCTPVDPYADLQYLQSLCYGQEERINSIPSAIVDFFTCPTGKHRSYESLIRVQNELELAQNLVSTMLKNIGHNSVYPVDISRT